MPIIRKVLNLGDSYAISLPKSWIESAEEKTGKKIVAVALEVDRIITLEPVFEKSTENKKESKADHE